MSSLNYLETLKTSKWAISLNGYIIVPRKKNKGYKVQNRYGKRTNDTNPAEKGVVLIQHNDGILVLGE